MLVSHDLSPAREGHPAAKESADWLVDLPELHNGSGATLFLSLSTFSSDPLPNNSCSHNSLLALPEVVTSVHWFMNVLSAVRVKKYGCGPNKERSGRGAGNQFFVCVNTKARVVWKETLRCERVRRATFRFFFVSSKSKSATRQQVCGPLGLHLSHSFLIPTRVVCGMNTMHTPLSLSPWYLHTAS